ncbi:protein translocase subunit secF /protein translocase subunit secD [Hoeflea marina]|uniref:Multifunctional fusion protein n=1 Tax=Hoeflea marina TaxID=274592 RepID=A0A317PXG4_9HYPH|nr:protein translocase subunit SecDF [Hoeflea marina]PWW04190.1 protein translocase subunit secF /protein translocase subunit secD [Hoeflea marina]
MLYFSRWKTTLIWLAVLAGVVFAFPNLLSQDQVGKLPEFLPSKKMTLGLDLQGGSHILLQIDREDIIKDRLASTSDEVRGILRDAGIGYTGLSGSGQAVQVRIRDTAKIEEAKTLLNVLTQPVNAGLFGGGNLTEATLEETQPGVLRVLLSDDGIDYRVSSAVAQSIEVVRRRVDELGTTEPSIQRQGTDRILVQVPGLGDPQRLKDLLNQTAKLTFRMVDTDMPVQEAMNGRPPAGSEVLYSKDDPPVPYLVKRQVEVSGENLVDAQAGFDQRNNEPIVSFKFDTKGGQRFGQITQQNVNRPFAIVLDNQVLSAPVIREPILGGSGQISGSFSVEGANDLAILLRAGALPATLTVIEERTVGPGLGADSIAAGEIAGIIGALLVVGFMFVAYGLLGFIANLALVANVTMIIAVLTILGATLTLPGIAGIVLTVGMAVDSNVLIYERIREEYRNGRSLIQAIDAGFSRAFATILDANVTTLIAAVILFYLGTGPVRGFAITLAIGIVTTVFTAFTFTRWMVAEWVRRRRPKKLPGGLLDSLVRDFGIRFMGLRRFTFMFSAVTSIAAMVLFATLNMNYGIDFKGGSMIELKAKDGAADISDIRARLSELNLGEVQVQEFGSPSEVLVRIQAQGGGENAEQTVITNIRGELEDTYEFRRVEVVGPTVSGELAKAGTLAVIAALMAILVYIWFRFEWQFALGAIIATVHDVVLTIGVFVISGFEFNLTSIAAVLTIVGYSLNDTVVVYDRVRENLRRYKKMPLPKLLDLSINQTLSRTILTSFTTVLALLALFIFGGEVIRSFTFAMIFGVLVGTYSSIFIAAPVLILFKLRSDSFRKDPGVAEETDGTQVVETGVAGKSVV